MRQPSSRKKQKKQSSNAPWLTFGAVVVIGAFVFFMAKSPKEDPSQTIAPGVKITENTKAGKQQNAETQKLAAKNAPKKVVNQATETALRDTATSLGMVRMPMPKSGDHYSLSLRLQLTEQCTEGEVDAMKAIATASGQSEFLLTVEQIDGNAHTLESVRLDARDLPAVKDFDFNVGASETPRRLGIYICFDPLGSSRCGDKPGIDVGKFIAKMDPLNLKNEKLEIKPGIIFFHPVETSYGGAAIIAKRAAGQHDEWEAGYLKYAEERYGLTAEAAKAPLAAYDAANSTELSGTGGRIILPLLVKGAKDCSQVSP